MLLIVSYDPNNSGNFIQSWLVCTIYLYPNSSTNYFVYHYWGCTSIYRPLYYPIIFYTKIYIKKLIIDMLIYNINLKVHYVIATNSFVDYKIKILVECTKLYICVYLFLRYIVKWLFLRLLDICYITEIM